MTDGTRGTRSGSQDAAREVALDDLILRKDLQPRGKPCRGEFPESKWGKAAQGKLSIPTVKRYATALRNGDTFDPILVARYRGNIPRPFSVSGNNLQRQRRSLNSEALKLDQTVVLRLKR